MNFIFDLDGVLVDFKTVHQDAFLLAWNSTYPKLFIDDKFHSEHLEARSTLQKLGILSKFFNLDIDAQVVSDKKQEITFKLLETSPVYSNTRQAIMWAVENNISISCCSNSIRKTVESSLSKLADLTVFKSILSNEDVVNPKPSPDIYNKAVELLGSAPSNTIVFEDSLVGKAAARAAGLNVVEIVDALDITPGFLKEIHTYKQRMEPTQINVVIPMAGLGSRFKTEGYEIPKPFLPVFGKPMFKRVIDNIVPVSLRDRANVHIVVRREHAVMFDSLKDSSRIHIHVVEKLTEGAACTVLTLKDHINNDFPLVIANSDQYLEWSADDFYRCLFHPDFDGVISTFEQPSPLDLRWSYSQINSEGCVVRVAEKEYIGPLATTGIYGWKRGSDFVSDAESMITQNIRVNNEFYVCPVYNLGIGRKLKIRTHKCTKMWGLGVPKDYEYFLVNHKFDENNE
jgi:beta-phosphoglucomutase-like phosphatase (HAD superfamily)/dTDP-glucose pyrophosphorylase